MRREADRAVSWTPRDLIRVRPRWALGIVVLLLAGLAIRITGLSWLASQDDETWAQIQAEKILRVGMDASYPPFEAVDDEGRFSGFDVELATALAVRWGIEPEFVNVHFDGLYDALKTGKFDLIISALPHDRTMTQDVLYSHSYYNAGHVLLARHDDESPRSLVDLDGKKVAVELGAAAHQLIRRLARDKGLSIGIIAEREAHQAAARLRESAVDALVCDRVTAYTYMGQARDLRLVGPPLADEPYVIAARLDSPLLMAQVDAALEEWRADGFLDELESRWF